MADDGIISVQPAASQINIPEMSVAETETLVKPPNAIIKNTEKIPNTNEKLTAAAISKVEPSRISIPSNEAIDAPTRVVVGNSDTIPTAIRDKDSVEAEKPIAQIRDPSEFPELQRCRYGDETCIVKMINIGLKNLHAGVPRLNMLPFDPLYAEKTLRIARSRSAESLVNLNFTYTDNEILGYRNHECLHVRWANYR